MRKLQRRHPFHIVTPSPWPFFTALSILITVMGCVLFLHRYESGLFTFLYGLFCLALVLSFWWRDVIREATFQGKHTRACQNGLAIGFVCFIISEGMFFFSFFWAFFHSALSPAVEIGCIWPPNGITPLHPLGIPLINTLVLVISGSWVNLVLVAVRGGFFSDAVSAFKWTINLGLLFTLLQLYEYKTAHFTIADGIYGSTFYLTTGFHGLHVIIGTIFLIVCFFRLLLGHFTREHHLGLRFAAWYWHFVDIVWLFVYASFYWWGNYSVF